jgi:hypothetical protein
MAVTSVTRFETFFRRAAGLDVDKSDQQRWEEFVNKKVRDLLTRGEAIARANGRPVIDDIDVPIGLGLQTAMHDFAELDEQMRQENETLDVLPLIDRILAHPPLARDYSDDLKARLPQIAGGLSLSAARGFKLLDPHLKNPQTEHWDRLERMFDLLI